MFSTKGRYALRFMADLAMQDPDEWIPLKDSAQRQGISKKYLEVIGKQLVLQGLLTAVSGKRGGYKLSRKPDKYTIKEILEAMSESLAPVACLQCHENTCERKDNCLTLPMWEKFYKMTDDFFSSMTLQDLIDQNISDGMTVF